MTVIGEPSFAAWASQRASGYGGKSTYLVWSLKIKTNIFRQSYCRRQSSTRYAFSSGRSLVPVSPFKPIVAWNFRFYDWCVGFCVCYRKWHGER